MKNTPLKLTLGAAAVAVVFFLGMTAYVSHQVHQDLDTLQQKGTMPSLTGVGSVQNLRAHKGFFSSTIDADIVVSSIGNLQSFPVHAKIDQWPSFGGPVRVKMTMMRPDFGPMHDFLEHMHTQTVMHGTMAKRWLGGVSMQAQNDGFSGNTAQGVAVKWGGGDMQINLQSSDSGDVQLEGLPLELHDPRTGGHLSIQSMRLSYGLQAKKQDIGNARFSMAVSGAQMGQSANDDITLQKASLDGQASWNTDPGEAHQFFSLDKADLDVDLTQPKGHAQAQAQATLPITPELLKVVIQQPALALLVALQHLDGRLTISADDPMLQAFPDLQAEAHAVGAVKKDGFWTVQAIAQGGQILVNGQRVK